MKKATKKNVSEAVNKVVEKCLEFWPLLNNEMSVDDFKSMCVNDLYQNQEEYRTTDDEVMSVEDYIDSIKKAADDNSVCVLWCEVMHK